MGKFKTQADNFFSVAPDPKWLASILPSFML